MPVRVAMS